MTRGIKIKSEAEIRKMIEGGKRLSSVKAMVKEAVKEGVNADFIDKLAEENILKAGGKPSFKMVPGYHWTTCININDGVVHGIPTRNTVFQKKDVVSVDVGMYYKGFHTDTSFTIALSPTSDAQRMLATGEASLKSAISKAEVGNRVYDISEAMEKVINTGGYTPIRALVGHGVGEELHEDPQIPCFAIGKREESPELVEGLALAIEVMYAQGASDVYLKEDGWTIATHDGKISALFEETVIVTKNGPLVIT